jgi:glycosyltransferase involved in cell wall biosynthesis
MMSGMASRILFISHDSALYGAQLSLLGLLTALDRTHFAPHVIAPYRGALTDRLEALGVPVLIMPLAHWVPPREIAGPGHLPSLVRSAPARISGLCRVIRDLAIDLVYTNTVTCVDGALASRLTRKPHVWHVREHIRGNTELKLYLPAPMVTLVISCLSQRVIVNSHALRDATFPGASRGRVTVIYNGVDVLSFAPREGGSRLRGDLGIPAWAKVVTIIGSIIPRKGIHTFVNAAACVRTEVSDVVFLIVGAGDRQYEREIGTLIDSLNLNRCIRLLGWRADVADLLHVTDVLISAAEQEPFGRTIIEAMAASTPVVATRSGGPQEIIVHGETGFLVPVGDAAAMGRFIIQLLKYPLRAQAFGAAGRRRAEQLFSLSSYVRRIEDVLNELLPTRSPSRPIDV